MAYLPLFFSLEGKHILLLGAGNIAEEKLRKLLNYTNSIDIIAKECSHSMQELIRLHGLSFTCKAYTSTDLSGYDIIIAAIDDIPLQENIYKEAKRNNILCNCVDLPKYCDFIFPAIVQKGDLQVAFSTGGTSPGLAKELRILFEQLIPDSIVGFLEEMKELRRSHPKGKERQQLLKTKAKAFIKKHFPQTKPTDLEE